MRGLPSWVARRASRSAPWHRVSTTAWVLSLRCPSTNYLPPPSFQRRGTHDQPLPRRRRKAVKRPLKSTSIAEEAEHDPHTHDALLRFRYRLSDRDPSLVHDYESHLTHLPLTPKDVMHLMVQLRRATLDGTGPLRNGEPDAEDQVQRLFDWIRTRRRRGDTIHVGVIPELIRICSTSINLDKAMEVLTWAENEANDLLIPRTYAVAILEAVRHDAGLDFCEQLFQRSLTASNNAFVGYASSPNSVLQQPDLPLSHRELADSPIDAIAKAQFRYGDWKSAYLMTDTSFRHVPAAETGRRVTSLLEHRSLEEVFRLSHTQCVNGGIIGQSLHRIFATLHKARAEAFLLSIDRPEPNLLILKASIDLLCTAVITKQPIDTRLARYFQQVVLVYPVVHLDSEIDQQRLNQLSIALSDAVGKLLSKDVNFESTQHDVSRSPSNGKLFTMALNALDIRKPLREPDVEKLMIMASRFDGTRGMSILRWRLEKDSGMSSEDLKQMMKKFGGPRSLRKVQEIQASEEDANALKACEARLKELQSQVEGLCSMVETGKMPDLETHPPPVPSLCPGLCQYPIQWHRQLYKEMHLDPLSPSAPTVASETSPTVSDHTIDNTKSDKSIHYLARTSVSYAEARFRSFQTINDLLVLAHFREYYREELASAGRSEVDQLAKLAGILARDQVFQAETDWKACVLALRTPTAERQQR